LRQKLLNTPTGLLALQKEQELEQEMSDLSKKCLALQNAVNAEKAMVEALSGRQGAVNKLKQAQEVIMLKTELERRTNDAKFYAFLLADTLSFIHSKKYVYRDMKAENVLIDDDGYPILCDFGFTKYPTKPTQRMALPIRSIRKSLQVNVTMKQSIGGPSVY
jgi:hypothetical protein